MRLTMPLTVALLGIALALPFGVTAPARAASLSVESAADIDRNVDAALSILYAQVPGAQSLGNQARGILVFPTIVKAGFLFGAQYGEGALRQKAAPAGYYNTASASYGLQAGVQRFGYALFFMTDSALRYLDQTGGFELGTGPSIAILDAGTAGSLSTTTMQHDIYAVFFDQSGLMAGLGIQGTKITRIEP